MKKISSLLLATIAVYCSLVAFTCNTPDHTSAKPLAPVDVKMEKAYYPCIEQSIVDVRWENVLGNNGYSVKLFENTVSGDSLISEIMLKKDSTYASFDSLKAVIYRTEVRTIALDSVQSDPILDTVSQARQTIITDKVVFLMPNSCARDLCGLDSNMIVANQVNYYSPLYSNINNPYEGYRIVLEYQNLGVTQTAEFKFTKKYSSLSIIRDRCNGQENALQLLDKNISCDSRKVTIIFDDASACEIAFSLNNFTVTPKAGFPNVGTTITIYRMRWQCNGNTQDPVQF